MILAGAGVYGYGRLTEDGGTGANLWVSSAGNSSCTRSSSTIDYAAALSGGHVCSDFDTAYHAASTSGDGVSVKCGTYGAQIFTPKATQTAMVVFQSETALCATVQGTNGPTISFGGTTASPSSPAASWITIQSFTILDGPSVVTNCLCVTIADTGATGAANISTHVSLLENNINVGVKVRGLQVYLRAAQNWVIDGNTFGPSCCGLANLTSPEPIRIAKPNSGEAASCTTQACNVAITNNLFQGSLRDASFWPSSGWGAAPDSSCLVSSCHLDTVHIFGCMTCQLNYNRVYGSECTGFFIEDTNNQMNSNIDIIGNAMALQAGGCNGSIGINFVGAGFGGTYNIKFNSNASNMNLNFNSTATFTVNLTGNYGVLFINGSGTSACSPGTGAPSATVNFRYNAWTSSSACSATDSASVAQHWVSSVAAPAVGQNMHTVSGTAIGYVPTSVTGGCPTIDFDGDAPSSPCNAGADQTAAAPDGSSQASCSPSPCTTGTVNSYSVSVDDGAGKTVSRGFKVYRPSGLTNSTTNRAPLILFWGNTDAGPCPSNCDWLPLQAIADANKFVVAAVTTHGNASPQSYAVLNSIPIATSIAPGVAGATDCGVSGTGTCDDSPLALGILAAVECNGALPCQNIDTARVYTMGGSKGGSMTEKMACDSTVAANFKGFVALSALVSAFGTDNTALPDCPYVRAGHHDFSFLWMYGSIDSLVYGDTTSYLTGKTFSGGRFGFAQADYPKVFMAPLLGCTTTPTSSTIISGVTLALHGSCTNSTVATGLVLNTGGGHSWTGLTTNSFTPFQYAWDWLVAHYPS